MEKDVFELLREVCAEEEFRNSNSRSVHYRKHVLGKSRRYNELGYRLFPEGAFDSAREYEKAADDLANGNTTSNNVEELVNENTGKHLKYDKDNGYLVIYKPDTSRPSGNLIYTFFMVDEEMLEAIKEQFLSEN